MEKTNKPKSRPCVNAWTGLDSAHWGLRRSHHAFLCCKKLIVLLQVTHLISAPAGFQSVPWPPAKHRILLDFQGSVEQEGEKCFPCGIKRSSSAENMQEGK